MAISGTNKKDITRDRLIEAQKELHNLQEWLSKVDEALSQAIKENDGRAFPIEWVSIAINKLLSIYNEVARCNGASLVSAGISEVQKEDSQKAD